MQAEVAEMEAEIAASINTPRSEVFEPAAATETIDECSEEEHTVVEPIETPPVTEITVTPPTPGPASPPVSLEEPSKEEVKSEKEPSKEEVKSKKEPSKKEVKSKKEPAREPVLA